MGDADKENQEVAFLVQLLPDNYAPSKDCTGISTRIYERRKAFFGEQRSLLSKELNIVGIEIEEKLTCCLKTLNNFIARNEAELDQLVSDSDPRNKPVNEQEACEQGETLSLVEFDECTKRARELIKCRRDLIEQTRAVVNSLEDHRAEEITKLFDVYVPRILKGSHLLQEDTCRIMEQEMLAINQVILRNRRAYIALFEQLFAQAVYREKACVETLKLHKFEWKKLEVWRAIEKMGEALEGTCKVDQSHVDALLEPILKCQEDLTWKKAGIVAELEQLVPPDVTVSKCRKWVEDMEGVISEIYDTALEGVLKVRKHIEDLHLNYFDEVVKQADLLKKKLQVSDEDIRFDFVEPCLFMSASRQAQFENDLQYYTGELNVKMDEEIRDVQSVFGFCHGATWHWELHLTCVAKAETFLDAQLQKQRTLLKTMYDTKTAPKLRIIFEALRRAGTPAAVVTQQTAAASAAKEVDGQLRDSWKKSLTYFGSYPSIIRILTKGYEERLCAYMQVSMKKPIVSPATEPFSPSQPPLPPKTDFSSKLTTRKLPDIPVDSEEKASLLAFGITPPDEENLGIRMKGLPSFPDDPRPKPPPDTLSTPSGVTFEPRPSTIEECFRFGVFPQAPLPKGQAAPHTDPNQTLLIETASQADMTKDDNDTTYVPKKLSLLNLDALVERSTMSSKLLVEETKHSLTRKFLIHLAEQWTALLRSTSNSFLETKKEAFELEIQTKLRCSALRVTVFVEAVARQRLEELTAHEDAYKDMETAVTTAIAELRTADLAGINQKLNDRLTGVKDTLAVIEKGLLNASRQAQIDQLKKRAQNENERFMEIVKTMLSEFRTKYPVKLQALQQQVRGMLASIKKFQDGGNYSPDEAKKFEQLFSKLIEKTTQGEKSFGTECQQIELKRKTAVDMLVNKSMEKVPAHEADVEAIRVLTGILAKAQAEIKKHAALVNTEYADVKGKMDYLRGVVAALRRNVTTAEIDADNVLLKLTGLLQETRACCGQLGCIGSSWPVPVISSVPETPKSPTATSRNIASAQSARSAKGANQPPLPPTEPALVREPTVTSFSLGSTRRSKIGAPLKAPPPLPTDFQLSTSDGPVPLAQPRIPVPMDGRPITSSGPKTAPSSAVGLKGNDSLTEKKGSKKAKSLEKYNIFGDAVLPDARTFLERVHVVCWQVLDESLTAAEAYHQAKSTRPVTRPNLIPNSLEETAERLCRKLLNYLTQSEEFAALMADRYREMASGLMDLIVDLAPLILRYLLGRFCQELLLKSNLIKDKYGDNCRRICDAGQDIDDLGIPIQLIRQNDIQELLKFFVASNKANWLSELQTLSEDFLRKLKSTVEKLFKAADLLITSEELQTPAAPPTLTIRAQSRRSMVSPVDDPRRSTVGQTWKAFDISGILEQLDETLCFCDIPCEKTTMAHLAVDDARHRIFSEFLQQLDIRKEEVAFFDRVPYKKPEAEQKEFIEGQLKRLEILDMIHNVKQRI